MRQSACFFGQNVGNDADCAAASQRHQRQNLIVVATIDGQFAMRFFQNFTCEHWVAARFLQPCNGGMTAEPGNRVGAESHARAPRHVIENHWQRARVENGLVMPN